MSADADALLMPWSAEAEQSVLGGLMLASDAMLRLADKRLTAGHFFDPRHGAIWTAMVSLHAARRPVDMVTTYEQLGAHAEECGGMAYLNALAMSVPSAMNIGPYADTFYNLPQAEYQRWVKATDQVDDDWIKDATERGAQGRRLLDEARALVVQFGK